MTQMMQYALFGLVILVIAFYTSLHTYKEPFRELVVPCKSLYKKKKQEKR